MTEDKEFAEKERLVMQYRDLLYDIPRMELAANLPGENPRSLLEDIARAHRERREVEEALRKIGLGSWVQGP